VKLGRIQNFKNWSPDMVPDPSKTCLGLEYFVFVGDEIWNLPDAELVRMASREIESLGLAKTKQVVDGTVVRQPKTYPVYDATFKQALSTICGYLKTLPGLQQVGRNGQHRYNNQDHSMMTALYAARNLLGAEHDIWNVNVEQEYHETIERSGSSGNSAGLGGLGRSGDTGALRTPGRNPRRVASR